MLISNVTAQKCAGPWCPRRARCRDRVAGAPSEPTLLGGPSVRPLPGDRSLCCVLPSLLPYVLVEGEGPGPEVEIPVTAEKLGLEGGQAWIWGQAGGGHGKSSEPLWALLPKPRLGVRQMGALSTLPPAGRTVELPATGPTPLPPPCISKPAASCQVLSVPPRGQGLWRSSGSPLPCLVPQIQHAPS